MSSGVFRWLFGDSSKNLDQPKYRLVPDPFGTYTLEKWDDRYEDYFCECVLVTKEEAEKSISNLENRKTIYWKE